MNTHWSQKNSNTYYNDTLVALKIKKAGDESRDEQAAPNPARFPRYQNLYFNAKNA